MISVKTNSTVVRPATGSLEPINLRATKAKGSIGAATAEPVTLAVAARLTEPGPMMQSPGAPVKGPFSRQSVARARLSEKVSVAQAYARFAGQIAF